MEEANMMMFKRFYEQALKEDSRGLKKKVADQWFQENLVYCSMTHGFVHRLYEAITSRKFDMKHYTDAQHAAQQILREMWVEFDEQWKEFLHNLK